MSKDDISTKLTQLGFTPNEAQVYLALVQNGPLGASAIANATGLARTVVYPTLDSLVDQGLVEAGHGYGSRFSAVPPERALHHLLLERERLTNDVIEKISSLEEPVEAAPAEFIQVIRSPRATAERFERLQLEAEKGVYALVKAPLFGGRGNPAQEKARRRGVRFRAIYEKAALEDPAIKPYLAQWLENGEEARVFDGELPHKLAIVDSKIALMPLFLPGQQMKAVLIQHSQLVQTLSLAFDHLWERSKPLTISSPAPLPKQGTPITQRISRNGRRSHSKK
jgi:sugar-specific transcriptional regulator TrmB